MSPKSEGWQDFLKDTVTTVLKIGAKEGSYSFYDKAKKKAHEVKVTTVRSAMVGIFFLVGFIFLLTGIAKYLNQFYTQFGAGTGFIYIAVALFILGLIVKAFK